MPGCLHCITSPITISSRLTRTFNVTRGGEEDEGGGEITSVLLLCYQSMYSSCDTTALHVAVAALKVLGSLYSSARSES